MKTEPCKRGHPANWISYERNNGTGAIGYQCRDCQKENKRRYRAERPKCPSFQMLDTRLGKPALPITHEMKEAYLQFCVGPELEWVLAYAEKERASVA